MLVSPDEFIGTRELSRKLDEQFSKLERKEVEKLVVLNRNKIRGVIVSAERYHDLTEAAAELTRRAQAGL